MFIASWVLGFAIQYTVDTLAAPAPAVSQTTSFATAISNLLAVLPADLTNSAQPSNIPVNLSTLPNLPSTNPTISTPKNNTRKFDYKVPKSATTIHLVLHEFDPEGSGGAEVPSVIETLASLQTVFEWKIAYGDRWLLKNIEDPTFYDIHLGCWLAFYSNPRVGASGMQQHLTLGIMLAVIKGLMDVLGTEVPEEEISASLAIEDSRWGIVGYGAIARTVSPPGGNPVQIVRETLHDLKTQRR